MTRCLPPAVVAAVLLATAGTVGATGAPQPGTLVHAQRIRAEVEARYAVTSGRRLRVTEASRTGIVASLTLLSDLSPEPRVVSAANGVFFAICPARARCPYPAPTAAERPAAFRPRRLAVELALRTFAETAADLVVVALPTRRPVFLVLERGDAPASHEIASAGVLTGDPRTRTAAITSLVEATTSARLFRPAGLASVSDSEDTLILSRVTDA